MSSMKNLDLIIQEVSTTPEDYDENKSLISMNLSGELEFKDLPTKLQDAMFQWEQEELELDSIDQYDIQPWEQL